LAALQSAPLEHGSERGHPTPLGWLTRGDYKVPACSVIGAVSWCDLRGCLGRHKEVGFQARACNTLAFRARVAQDTRGVVKGAVKGVTRASFGRRAPLTPQLQRASTRRREEEVFRGVHMIQQVAAVHLGWGQAPSLDTKMIYETTIWVLLDRYGEF